MKDPSARFYTLLSIVAAILTIALKAGAYFLTGLVGLLSDAAESCVNLVAAIVATWAVTFAAKPPDAEHEFGHYKAEYFSSGVEGALNISGGRQHCDRCLGTVISSPALRADWYRTGTIAGSDGD